MIVAALFLGVFGGSVTALGAGLFFDASFLLCFAIYIGAGLLVTVMALGASMIQQARRQNAIKPKESNVAHA